MKNIILEFLRNKENLSQESKESYERILIDFFKFLKNANINSSDEIDDSVVESFLMFQENQNKSKNTIKKYLSVIKTFFNYLKRNSYIDRRVGINVKFISNTSEEKKDILSKEEYNEIIDTYNNDKFLDVRDRLVFSLLYNSEIKVNELIGLKLNDVSDDFYTLKAENKYISLNNEIHRFLIDYLKLRKELESNNNFLIINYTKTKISRQGIWKLIRKKSKVLDNDKNLNPEILNRSYKFNKILSKYNY